MCYGGEKEAGNSTSPVYLFRPDIIYPLDTIWRARWGQRVMLAELMPTDGWLHSPEPPGPGPHRGPHRWPPAWHHPPERTPSEDLRSPPSPWPRALQKPCLARRNPPQARHKSQRIPNWNCVSSANCWPQRPNYKDPFLPLAVPPSPVPEEGCGRERALPCSPRPSTSGPRQTHCQRHQPGPLAGTGLRSNRAQTTLLHINSAPAASADTIISVHNSPQRGCCHSFSFIFSCDWLTA